MKNRSLLILASLTAVAVIGAVLAVSTRESAIERVAVETAIFPELKATINDVAAIELTPAGGAFRLSRSGQDWVVASKADYPARSDLVREMLLQITELAGLEAKTANPERHAKLGLAEPGAQDGAGTSIAMLDGEGNPLAELIVGNGARNKPDQRYVRRSDNNQTWLVRSELDPGRDASDWVETLLLRLPLERVRTVRIEHPDGEVIDLSRETPDKIIFALAGMPEGATFSSPKVIENMIRSVTIMRFDDVVGASEMPEPDGDPIVTRFDTFDGQTVIFTLYTAGEETWVRIEASYDAAAAMPEVEVDPEEDPLEAALPFDVEETVADVVAVTESWVFMLPDFKVDQLTKRLDDLINMPVADGAADDDEPGFAISVGDPTRPPIEVE
jgi:hypothetical protein